MQHLPRWAAEPSNTVPGISVIGNNLASSSSCQIYIDSIRVYLDRVYLRMGIKFQDRESWHRVAINGDTFMGSDAFRARIKHRDGSAVAVSSFGLHTTENSADDVVTPNAPNTLWQVNTRGAGLEWFVDYLIFPTPISDVVFSAEFPQLSVPRGQWTLPRQEIETCLEAAARYAGFCALANDHGHSIRSNLVNNAEIAARLLHLGAEIDFGEENGSWEPSIRIPLGNKEYLMIHEILPGDRIDIKISGSSVESYLLEISGNSNLQAMALSGEVAQIAEVLTAGLSK
jgi:hypothetical protein